MESLILRAATPADLASVDALLSRSYPRLLKKDYPPSVLVSAVPIISRARPELLASGRYFVVMDGDRALGAGGYSPASPSATGAGTGAGTGASTPPGPAGLAHIRHVATDPDATRRGIGRALMQRIFASAALEGLTRFDCMSTRTAVPFYAAVGFRAVGEIEITLSPGVVFPAVRMIRP